MKKIILLLMIIISHAFSQNINNWTWAKLYGGNYADGSNSITTDGTYIYQTGYWVSDINFGNGYNFGIYVTGNNFFLHKADNAGNTQWAKVIISDNATVGSVVHAAKNNRLIVGGTTMGSTILNNPHTLNNPFPGKRMIFLLQYDTSGNLLWSQRMVSPNHQDITNIKTDKDNNIYIAGYFQGKYLVYANDTLFNTDTSGISIDVKFHQVVDENLA